VKLKPIAVELVDRTMLELAGESRCSARAEALSAVEPEAILLVEFDDGKPRPAQAETARAMMGDLGFGFDKAGAKWGGLVEVLDPAPCRAGDCRRAHLGLNIMMSMKEQGKPISFVEDCAVPLVNLAEYTRALRKCSRSHGTRGTWYAHASVGCLHVAPVLNLRQEKT